MTDQYKDISVISHDSRRRCRWIDSPRVNFQLNTFFAFTQIIGVTLLSGKIRSVGSSASICQILSSRSSARKWKQ